MTWRTGNSARKICSAILSAARNATRASKEWSPLMEQALHSIGCRSILNPSIVSRVIMPGLLNHHPLALGFFHWAAQQPGFSHTPETYRSLFSVLSRSKQHASIHKLFAKLCAQSIHLDPDSYSSVLRSQLVCKKTHLAFSTFMAVDRFNEIDGHVCNSLLAALASDGYLDLAGEMFEKMRFGKMAFTTLGFGVFVGTISRRMELEKILGLIDGIENGEIQGVNGSIVALLVADGLCRASRTREGWWVLELLRKRGCKPDFIAYSVVIESLRNIACAEEAQKVLKQKRKLSVAPRLHEYKEFILSLIQERRIREAKEVVEAILRGNFPIDDDLYNEVISSFSSTDADAAIAFCKSMLGNDRFPSVDTLKNLSQNLSRSGKTNEMWDLFKLLGLKDYFSNTESYNVVVFSLCSAGKVKEAYEVLREMRRGGHSPDIVTYNTLMEACCREDMLRPARRLWDEMFAKGCPGNLESYNVLIRKFSDSGEVDAACRLFDHMLTRNILPNKVTYSSLIKGLCRELKVDDAVEIFHKSLKHHTVLGGSTLNTLIHSLCKAGDYFSAMKVVCGLLHCDIDLSDSNALLLKNLAEAGHFDMAVGHVECVRCYSPLLLQDIVRELAGYLSTCLKPEPVLQLLQVMHGKGLIADNGPWRNLSQIHLPELGRQQM